MSPIDHERRSFLAAAAATIAAGRLGFLRIPGPGTDEGELGSLDRATGWVNSPPLTAAGLKGKVVLASIWTYSCINWLRSHPYVRAWADRYRDRGLVVIGVHSPEFGFERDLGNVQWAAKALRVDYPVALDSDYAIWKAFDNNYWPALYFLDTKGRVQHHHYGEGDYVASEQALQRLLGVNEEPVSITGTGLEAPADWPNLRSPESYLGTARRENARVGRLNHWSLAGDWIEGRESITLAKAGGKIGYRFHARDLHLVMGPGSPGAPVAFRVRLDGAAPGAAHGIDIDAEGAGRIVQPRLYQLIRQPDSIADRQFEIEFLDPGAEAYVFTFG
jgi:hypothetical protein